MTLAYRDSSWARPNADQAAAAFGAGVRVWGGYLAAVVPPGPRSQGGSNLLTTWTQADFQVLQAAGIACLAFCSGWDDAAACRALARAWGVRPMLDVEDAIRGDGAWVDGWLVDSGAGLYGLCEVHYHLAPAHIVARYPDVTVDAATWDPECQAPGGLLGWQAQGSHTDPATGLEVDGGWVDDGYADAMTTSFPAQDEAEQAVDSAYEVLTGHTAPSDADREHWVEIALTEGLRSMFEQFAAAAEATAHQVDMLRMLTDYRAGKLGEGTLVAHTHSGGTTGPASAM